MFRSTGPAGEKPDRTDSQAEHGDENAPRLMQMVRGHDLRSGWTARMFTALCLLGAVPGAHAQSVEVESFEYLYASGRVVRLTDIGSSLPSPATASRLQTQYPDIGPILLFCTELSGPRFAYFGGAFYKLNEKARREDARVVTNEGPQGLLDIDEPPSPLAGDFRMILNLVRDAGEGC